MGREKRKSPVMYRYIHRRVLRLLWLFLHEHALCAGIDIGVAGLTNSSNRSNVIIMINTISITSFETTLHHEIMHYIDYYLADKIGAEAIEASMNKLNP